VHHPTGQSRAAHRATVQRLVSTRNSHRCRRRPRWPAARDPGARVRTPALRRATRDCEEAEDKG
jgi:hypothetical protein